MKKRTLGIVVPILALGLLAGCNGGGNPTSSSATLDAPTNFTFDFNNSSYSFTGSPNATFYSIKVYQYVDEVLDTHAVASSGMIRASEDNGSYTGTIDYAFLAGDYRAVIKAIAPRYKTGEATTEGTSIMQGSPEVSASFNDPNNQGGGFPWGGPGPMSMDSSTMADGDSSETEEETDPITIDITITAIETITVDYTLTMINTDTNDVVYTNPNVLAGEINLGAEDLTGVAEITTDDNYSVTVQGNRVEGYTQAAAVTVTVTASSGGWPGGPGGPGGPGF